MYGTHKEIIPLDELNEPKFTINKKQPIYFDDPGDYAVFYREMGYYDISDSNKPIASHNL